MRCNPSKLLLMLIPLAAMQVSALGQPAVAPNDDIRDGTRALEVPRYGIALRHPQAWQLVAWGVNERAFVLRLPQEEVPEDRPRDDVAGERGGTVGFVRCELSQAPSDLEEYRRRHQATAERLESQPAPPRTLLANDLRRTAVQEIVAENPAGDEDNEAAIPERRNGAGHEMPMLLSAWQHRAGDGRPAWFEVRAHLLSGDMLYTFTLTTDEAHYEAYRADFLDMLRTIRFSPPQTGLQRLPEGYWLQREFRFALRLPPDWQPAFGQRDEVLFFARGATNEVWTDNLMVTASRGEPRDLETLQNRLPDSIRAADPNSRVARCEIVDQGETPALETVIHTERGPWKLTIYERRFHRSGRNYEIRFTVETETFQRRQADYKAALDSFIEVHEEGTGPVS